MGTWMGHDYDEDPVEDSLVTLWRSTIERLQEAIIDIGMEYRPCYDEVDTQRRRASILKRRRIFVNA
ncbi:hypothetical protein DMN91_001860 [Ooceraea biroi]|uniref:Uncharacterized protein n=1 Tax=Ooceraea biroi TaxID=2015173 RepID=A0A3L8DZP8_OOCBI|nr:hypothetical protein DMN91_001860 [Ooceraea biroi]